MPIKEKHLFEQFEKLAKNVKTDFKKKGLVVPVQNRDGTIQIGVFAIKKKDSAYYVTGRNGDAMAGPLNLAQTAILVANDLALGRWPDPKLIDSDTWYGYKAFAEASANSVAERARKDNDADRADFSQYKAAVAAEQKLSFKKVIDQRYNKLCKLS
jgi:hypothetical protein